MHVIRHYDHDSEIEFCSVVMETAFENDRTYLLWKNPPLVSAECYKMLSAINLQMRKLPAVESLRHSESCGDSRHRLSGRAELCCPW